MNRNRKLQTEGVRLLKRLALIGSSGGNFYRLGGSDPEQMLTDLIQSFQSTDFELANLLFVAADQSLDKKQEAVTATLYIYENNQLKKVGQGSLHAINQQAARYDSELAAQIEQSAVDGLITISSDPLGINARSVDAAIRAELPIAGTGGTSMATIQSSGGLVISVSGTTGTSNETRTLSLVAAFVRHWKIRQGFRKYIPNLAIDWSGLMTSGLPAFIVLTLVAASTRFSWVQQNSFFHTVQDALPVVLAVLAARRIAKFGEMTLIAGILAGSLAASYGVIAGLFAGVLCGITAQLLFQQCLKWAFPLTAANLLSVSVSGLLPGILLHVGAGNLLLRLQLFVPDTLGHLLAVQPIVIGATLGVLMWFFILKGGYHAVVLPLLLIELAGSGFSYLGAFDLICLVLVAAGINLANYLFDHSKSARTGLFMNLLFGTLVESVYPSLKNKRLFVFILVVAGASGAFVAQLQLRGTAYIPVLLAPFLSTSLRDYLFVMLGTVILSFLAATFIRLSGRRT